MSELISLREFGRRVGVSDTAVRKAIAAGKIVKGLDRTNPKRPKIIPQIAIKEWGRYYNPNYEREQTKNLHVESDNTAPPPEAGTGRSLAEIKRQQAEVKLRITALELKEKQGQLVDKAKVYKALFSAGQEVRTAMQAIPDRVIDDLLAAKTRNESHQILFNAIADTLEMLSEITNREINT
jgi:hypothetical protein